MAACQGFVWVGQSFAACEECGWSMPELWCPEHGNFGMTFLSAKVGAIMHVKAVLA